jgi:hypothetical protein
MVGITSKLGAAAKIKAESKAGEPLSVDQKSRLMDIWATHAGNTTLHRGKGSKAKNYAKGGFVISDSDWRRNKARELNEGGGAVDRQLSGLEANERTKYAKK